MSKQRLLRILLTPLYAFIGMLLGFLTVLLVFSNYDFEKPPPLIELVEWLIIYGGAVIGALVPWLVREIDG